MGGLISSFVFWFFFFKDLFTFERERESASECAMGQREKEILVDPLPSSESDLGLDLTTLRSCMT